MAFPLPGPMRIALDEARKAASEGEVPVGAVVTRGGELIAVARNAMRATHDPSAHAEMVALRDAARIIGSPRLDGCDLWVTLEPCAMCAGAVAIARIARLYFAAPDPKGGAVVNGPRLFGQSTCHHAPEVYSGIGEQEAAEMLRQFFRERRANDDALP
ncbi:MAG TPA: nucleoside deaminase [Allosphingosinicella sp.]|nr:nucleoside deaminase [Allosphingosinicella sp.]